MSLFYLMPPRPLLGDHFAAFLHTFFPGLDWDTTERIRLANVLGEAAGRDNIYIVFRDDLPRDESPIRALVDGFGAEAGDEVVEVRPSGRAGEMTARRWSIG